MHPDVLQSLLNRSSDLRAIILPFVLAHTGILIVLGFAGEGLEDSGVQLALAAMAVLGSLWSFIWTDGAMADIGAGVKDMDEEMRNSNIGRNFAKAPFGLFRLINGAVVTLIVVAELIAIY